MGKKTVTKVESKERASKRLFSDAVRVLRALVKVGEISRQEAVSQRQAWLDGEALPE